MDDLVVARVLHVLGVVVWLGGLSLVTTALLPAIRRGELGSDWLAAFQAVERRFSWQVRVALIVVGGSGLYLIVQADLWERFRLREYWWMHAMVALWVLFALGLFAVEPLLLDRHLPSWSRRRPAATFAWLARVHWLLLLLSLVTLLGAVAGSHGWSIF